MKIKSLSFSLRGKKVSEYKQTSEIKVYPAPITLPGVTKQKPFTVLNE